MTELKTLKDFEGIGNLIPRDRIKKEAIKWVKTYENCKHPTINENVKLFIKHFFNLTEEDLQ